MKTKSIKSSIGILLTLWIFQACSTALDSNAEATSPQTAQALPVDVQVVTETFIHKTEVVAGSVLPNRSVDIMSELSKKITSVHFKDGSWVSAGQILYKLDDADIKARLHQLEAELNLAAITEKRFNELLKTETVRQEEYDIAFAKLHSLKAAKEILEVELSKTVLTAPFAGVAGISKVVAGAFVSPGIPLVCLQDQATLKIQFAVSEKYVPIVKAGSKIEFSTEINPEKSSATVFSTEASLDLQSRNIIVQATVSNSDGRLKPGMSAKVFFNTSNNQYKAITIPTEALIPGTQGYSVFVIKDGAAKSTPVSISNRDEASAWINSGLDNGDTVMISNILRTMDGTPVSIASFQ